MDAIDALQQRTASPRLKEPAPSEAELEIIYKSGLRAPDHGMLRPWHFLVVKGEAREKLGELFADSLNPDSEEQKRKLRNAPMRAPIVIVAVAEIQEHPKVPPVEQITATAAAIQNMSVAIHALGYSSIWRTGKAAFDDGVKEALGFSAKDEIVGFLYVGTPTVQRDIPENKVEDYFKEWSG
ncbi:MAG: nitroreductase family protein [Gammaproteobacteria bacterium]|nr:nitroreductase family protein [Gammaproteobacteria bacterium]